MMKRITLILILLACPFLFGQSALNLQNYIGKQPEQISGIVAGQTKVTSADYWNDYAYSQIQAVIYRLNQYRASSDYTNVYAAWDSGHVFTILPGDTVDIAQIYPYGSPESYSAIVGSGPSSVLTSTKANYSQGFPVLHFDSDSFVLVQNLTIFPDTSTQYAIEHDHCISIKGASNYIVIDNCWMPACNGDGILITEDGTDVPENIIITNNCIYGDTVNAQNWALPMARNGIAVVQGRNIIIDNNYIEGFPGPGCIDLEPNSGDSYTVENVIISNNMLVPRHDGVQLNGTGPGWNNVTITGNVIDGENYSYNRYGIYAIDYYRYDRNVNISNNVITNMQDGIIVRNTTGDVVVNGNTVYDNRVAGIQLTGTIERAVVSNNTIRGNGGNGLYLYAYIPSDCTDYYIDNYDFETEWSSDWYLDGSTTSGDTSSTYALGGTYSWRVVSTDADSGIYQPLATAASDSPYVIYGSFYVYITDDSSFSAVEAEVKGARWFKSYSVAREEVTFDSVWQRIDFLFHPSGTDTLRIKSVEGACVFYVDSLTLYRGQNIAGTVIEGNIISNNEGYGIKTDGYIINTDIINNKVFDKKIYVGAANTQQYGFRNSNELFNCKLLGNEMYGHTNQDLYLRRVIGCQLSYMGIEDVYVDVNSADFFDNSFPYAKPLTFYGDVYPNTTHLPFRGYYHMPCQGHLVAITSQCDSAFTAGIMYITPVIGDTDLSAGAYYAANISFTGLGSVSGTKRLMNQGSRATKFDSGDRVTVSIAADANVPDTTQVRVTLWYE